MDRLGTDGLKLLFKIAFKKIKKKVYYNFCHRKEICLQIHVSFYLQLQFYRKTGITSNPASGPGWQIGPNDTTMIRCSKCHHTLTLVREPTQGTVKAVAMGHPDWNLKWNLLEYIKKGKTLRTKGAYFPLLVHGAGMWMPSLIYTRCPAWPFNMTICGMTPAVRGLIPCHFLPNTCQHCIISLSPNERLSAAAC